MILPPVQYLRPASPAEAVTMLSEVDGSVVLAGGQTLLNMLKLDLAQPSALVDVHRIDGLRGVRTADDGTLVVGAATTYASLSTVHGHPVADMAAGLVDRQVRNRGTIGGNCCLNDPTNNFPPLLSALGARFRILGAAGERMLPADEFFLGTLATAVRPGELLTAIEIPPLPSNAVVAHEHLQVGADSWALARAVVRLDVTGGVVTDARVFLGAVYGSPLRLPEVERHLVGAAVTPSLADVTGVLRDVDAADDVHCSAAYRREMAEVQLRRALLAAVQRSTR